MIHCKLQAGVFPVRAVQPSTVLVMYSHAERWEATMPLSIIRASDNAVWNTRVPSQTWLHNCQLISHQPISTLICRVANRRCHQRLLQICPIASLGWDLIFMMGILTFHFEPGILIMPPLGDGLPPEPPTCWTSTRLGGANQLHLGRSDQPWRMVRCHHHSPRPPKTAQAQLCHLGCSGDTINSAWQVCRSGHCPAVPLSLIWHVFSRSLFWNRCQWLWCGPGSRCSCHV